MSIIIGVTGPTGAGKSSLLNTAVELGFKFIDCDKFARKAVKKGTKGLDALIKVFGQDILNVDKTLNRKELAKIAFSSQENTELLNKTILPFIVELINDEIRFESKVVLDAPTLFESGIDSICDVTVAVTSDVDIRLKRIMQRDKLDKDSAMLRINAGKSDEFYKSNADFLIFNNGEIEQLIEDFKKIVNQFA